MAPFQSLASIRARAAVSSAPAAGATVVAAPAALVGEPAGTVVDPSVSGAGEVEFGFGVDGFTSSATAERPPMETAAHSVTAPTAAMRRSRGRVVWFSERMVWPSFTSSVGGGRRRWPLSSA